ncbi:YeeE/YedE family protein [Aquimarina litoralis]|uniref:YeeE/YedE family protein n=1 Tax=Aquimarina litoralis TaxID=584605 RepID=UPI001C562A6C|nr:YeeE/YedE thiosulfate transporter family protein [Aquimarina litoralis]MBW1294209.1 YeeE/YedE family protein [Aquimarina litoralis]
MNWIQEPWPWFVAGPLIAFVMILLLMFDKKMGMSSNLRTLCTICGAGKASSFFKFNWKEQRWNLIVASGMILGGFIGANLLSENQTVNLAPILVEDLKEMGFDNAGEAYLPSKLFSNSVFNDAKTLMILVLGGLLVGFGARYAGGCTSGHAISGLSDLQLPSLIAVIGFFIGGLLMVHFIFPFVF